MQDEEMASPTRQSLSQTEQKRLVVFVNGNSGVDDDRRCGDEEYVVVNNDVELWDEWLQG
jgi:hypothetical protein